MSMNLSSSSPDWPALPFAEWEKTCDTLHMWTQIVGKTRMAREPLVNHWWNVTLYVTPLGLTTSPIPYQDQTFEIDFDLVSHRLRMVTSHGREYIMCLYPRSVADFFSEYMSALRSLGIEIHINPAPAEFDDTTPYDQDQHHASYDKAYVERFRRILIQSDRMLKKFRTRFLGKCSPVHFFWGSFDLAVTRFSGRRAPEQPSMDPMMREGYSHEVTSCGFWPGDRRFKEPAFYAYAAPSPPGLADEPVRPRGAYWDKQLGEFIFKYDEARNSPSPEAAVLDFCQSTYEAGAKLAQWDRASLER
jgi:hypothetical protein